MQNEIFDKCVFLVELKTSPIVPINMDQSRPYTFDRVVRIVLTLAVFGGIIFLINRLDSVLVPFIVAVFIAYLLNPAVTFMEKRFRFHRGVAVILSIAAVILVFTGILWWLIPTFLHEMNRMGQLVKLYLQSAHLSDHTIQIEAQIKDLIHQYELVNYLTSDNFIGLIPKILPKFWSIFAGSFQIIMGILGVFIVLLYTIFLLIDYEKLERSWSQLIPLKYRPFVERVVADLQLAMRVYIRAQGTIALLVGILLAIGFSIIGLPMAILIGLFIGLLNFVPYLQIIGLPPALMLALLKSLDQNTPFWQEALWVFVVMAIVQAIQELILNPRILGKAYSLNPAIILLALSIWGSLMGVVGMMLALPLTTLIYSYYKNIVILDKDILTGPTEDESEHPPLDLPG